jgi:hypothetical protein
VAGVSVGIIAYVRRFGSRNPLVYLVPRHYAYLALRTGYETELASIGLHHLVHEVDGGLEARFGLGNSNSAQQKQNREQQPIQFFSIGSSVNP